MEKNLDYYAEISYKLITSRFHLKNTFSESAKIIDKKLSPLPLMISLTFVISLFQKKSVIFCCLSQKIQKKNFNEKGTENFKRVTINFLSRWKKATWLIVWCVNSQMLFILNELTRISGRILCCYFLFYSLP